jgi:hypothetical protein
VPAALHELRRGDGAGLFAACAREGPLTFGESISGWGLSYLWGRLLPYPEYKTAVVDAVSVVHTSPIRQGTLRPTLDALGIDPEKERDEVTARHGIKAFWLGEYARLRISHGDE